MLSVCQQVCRNLEKKYKDYLPIQTYLNSIKINEKKEGSVLIFTLSSPSAFLKQRIEQKVLPLFKKELALLMNNSSFQIQSSIDKILSNSKKQANPPKATPIKKVNSSSLQKKNPFNSLYTFENFISGPSNNMAFSAVKNLAQTPLSNPYSPLFIHGKTGLGKTHLLHALGQKLFFEKPELKIHYLSAERFLYECVQAIRQGCMDLFRKQYRDNSHILLIDDIQAIEKGHSSQEEFFHTFNTISEKGGLIVCTCDRLPREIKKMETRLQTRLSGGLVIQIDPPDLETRMAILQRKAKQRNIPLPHEILLFIAQISTASIRELEGNLNKIKMACEIQNQKPELTFAKKVFSQETSSTTYIDEILEHIASEYHISIAQMLSSSRSKTVLKARQKAICTIHKRFNHLTLSEIGRVFGGKSHSTILYTLRKKR